MVGTFKLTILGTLFQIMHWEGASIFYLTALLLSCISWIVVVNDMYQTKIHNRNFWVFLMYIVPSIATIVYLVQRKKLIEMGESAMA